jgi:pilus assembly protein CpaE
MTRKILVLDRSEELAERLRPVLADLDEAIELVTCTRIGSADHVHDHEGPFAVLVAGPSLPADEASIRGALRRALDLSSRRGAVAPPTAAAPADSSEVTTPVPTRAGKIYTVSSPTGGCGKTFYATNMALLLARHPGARVALVDLDLQFGEVTAALRLSPTYTIFDLLKVDESENPEFASAVEECLVPYAPGGFSVLAAPKDPVQADRITPIEVTRILSALKERFDYVVVDTPAALAETVLAAFDLSEHLFILATLDLPSVRNLGMFLQTLEKLRMASDNVSLVLNKVEKDVGISVGQITKLFPQGFSSTLPYAREVSRSVNLGRPVVLAYPDADIARQVIHGLHEFLPQAARGGSERNGSAPHGLGILRFFRKRWTGAAS